MPTARVNGRRLGYTRQGSGAPLLLVPGMGMHHAVWGEQFMSGLRERFDVVALDHRNVAESDDVPGTFTVADLAEDAVGLLDALSLDRVHLLGFSLGGMVAQEIALGAPDRVRTLVLASTYAGGPGCDLNAPGPLSMLQASQLRDAEVMVRATYAANFSVGYAADDSHYEPFKRAALSQRISLDTIVAQARAAFAHNTSDRLGQLRVPTLVLHGTQDQMILYSNGALLATLVPGATLHTFDDSGHLITWEHPDEVVALIDSHAERG